MFHNPAELQARGGGLSCLFYHLPYPTFLELLQRDVLFGQVGSLEYGHPLCGF